MTTVRGPGGGLLDGMDAARRPTGPVVALVVVLVCWAVGNLIGAVVKGVLVRPSPSGMSTPALLIATVLVSAITVGLLALWIRVKEVRPFATVGLRGRAGRPIALGAVTGLVMFAVVALVALGTGTSVLTPPPGDVGGVALVVGVVLALVGFAVAATVEEVLTRGYTMPAVARRWGLGAAVAVQAVLFALLHSLTSGVGVLPVINLLLVAVFLAGWALLEGGLWGVCAWHALWNWTEGSLFGVAVSGSSIRASVVHVGPAPGAGDVLTGGAFGLEGSVITTVVLLVAVLVTAGLWRRRRARA